MNSIFLSADSTCDIDLEMQKKYKIHSIPIHISLDGKEYRDGIDISPNFMYRIYHEKKLLPKTSAISKEEYKNYFKKLKNEGAREIVHISLSSSLSSTYQNAKDAGDELGDVYVIDSKNLSFGSGMLVLEAFKKIQKEIDAKQIFKDLNKTREKIDISFLLSTLDFMSAGGRCPSVLALGVSFLGIKPCIRVEAKQGKMSIAKVYRGKLQNVLPKYINEKLQNKTIKNYQIFIAHSGVSKEILNLVSNTIKHVNKNYVIKIVRAGCTITSHCGPDTVGIAFIKD